MHLAASVRAPTQNKSEIEDCIEQLSVKIPTQSESEIAVHAIAFLGTLLIALSKLLCRIRLREIRDSRLQFEVSCKLRLNKARDQALHCLNGLASC